jgi:hypothetical protein
LGSGWGGVSRSDTEVLGVRDREKQHKHKHKQMYCRKLNVSCDNTSLCLCTRFTYLDDDLVGEEGPEEIHDGISAFRSQSRRKLELQACWLLFQCAAVFFFALPPILVPSIFIELN